MADALALFWPLEGHHDRVVLHPRAPLSSQRPQSLEEGHDPQLRSLVFVVVRTLLGWTIFYSQVEGWSVVDALYFR